MSPANEPSPFTQLFVRSQRRIYGYILTLVPDPNEADEIFQETSLLLWQKADQFDPAREFVPWACGIALNVVRNDRVKKGRDRHLFSDELISRIAEVRETRSEWLDRHSGTLAACIAKLSDQQRELLRDIYGRQRPIPDLAESLKIKVDALYQRLHRIRRQLLECVQRNASEETA